jgi:hypothetical protein
VIAGERSDVKTCAPERRQMPGIAGRSRDIGAALRSAIGVRHLDVPGQDAGAAEDCAGAIEETIGIGFVQNQIAY